MESNQEVQFRELSSEELDQVAGGNPLIAAAMVVSAIIGGHYAVKAAEASCPAE